ncbi:hypothetical protein [Psychrobacillus sp. L3]|uniref:hypothetical protein n=1 Tax=Psychrobacillus sp. L3 TaxID=3236891 RepID=UPI0036F1F666
MLCNLWKYSNTHYALYITDKKVMQSINRYYLKKGFKEMATYQKDNKIIARQYLIPVNQLRTAKRLEKVGNE